MSSKAELSDGGFKLLVGGDPVRIYPKYNDEIIYVPFAKHVIATNHLPRITDHSRAIFNRLLLLKFNHPTPSHLQDRDITDKLKSEAEGILA